MALPPQAQPRRSFKNQMSLRSRAQEAAGGGQGNPPQTPPLTLPSAPIQGLRAAVSTTWILRHGSCALSPSHPRHRGGDPKGQFTSPELLGISRPGTGQPRTGSECLSTGLTYGQYQGTAAEGASVSTASRPHTPNWGQIQSFRQTKIPTHGPSPVSLNPRRDVIFPGPPL